jgi:signal transduction histidine kinase
MKSRHFGIRAKLSLIAVLVVTVLYVLLGVTVFFVAKETILGSVRSGLLAVAHGFGDGRHRPPPGPPDEGPDRGPRRGPPDFRDDSPGRPRGRPRDRPDDPIHPGPDGRGRFGPSERNRPELPSRRPHPPVEAPDVKDTRPRIVWLAPGARLPFPNSTGLDPLADAAAKRGVTTLHQIAYAGEPVEVMTFPVFSPFDKHLDGVVEVSRWLGDIDKFINSLAGTLLLILPFGIVLMGSASMYVVGKTLKPVRDIRSAAERMEAEDLSGRLPVVGSDEFAELAETMNGMLGRLDVAFSRQREALDRIKGVVEQQRRFTADASHELKTPLTVVKVHASLLKSSVGNDPDALESIDSIDQAVNRMAKLVQDLLLLARTDAGQLSEKFILLDLRKIAEQAASQVPCGDKIRVVFDESPLLVNGLSFGLDRLVTNLLDNACRHTPPDGSVDLTVKRVEKTITLSVSDDGEGIPPEHLGKIFDRFHRVDSSRYSGTGGAGLGLAICKGIVEAHGGTISVISDIGKGTTFTVQLPSADEH